MRNLTSGRLKEATLERLTAIMEDGAKVVIEDEVVMVDPSPQHIAQAVNFLKVFPPDDPLTMLTGHKVSDTLKSYSGSPFPTGTSVDTLVS